MRHPAPMLAALVLLAAAYLPIASASAPGAHLAFSPSEGLRDLAPGESTSLLLTLEFELSGIACVSESRAIVALSAETEGSLDATPSLDQVEFLIPAGSYVATPHREARELALVLAAPGDAKEGPASTTLRASLNGLGAGCVAPDERGRATTSLSFSLRILPPPPPASPVGAGGSADDAEPAEGEGNTTAEGSEGAAGNETAEPAPDGNRTAGGNGTRDAPLPPGGGFIGDFAPEESTAGQEVAATPLHGLALIVVGACVAAVAWGRKR